jgi:type II secretory pathway pseudopilin PulG
MTCRQSAEQRGSADSRGISIVEVLVAVTLLAGVVTALAQLVTLATRVNLTARATTQSVVLAAQKMEQLRARPDVDRSTPGGSLQVDVQDFSDFFDATPLALPSGAGRPPGTVFVRRWAIEQLASDPSQSRVLAVRVLRVDGGNVSVGWPGRQPEEARLITVVTARDR